MEADLALYLFGAPRIEREGKVVEVDTRKALALAAYLALSGGMQRREALSALLWPDYEPERAHANLRRTLWSLRQAVGDEWLDSERDGVCFAARPGLRVDVLEFRLHLESRLAHGHGRSVACPDCIPALEAAVALYRGDFLAGFTLRDAPDFDDWQLFHAEELRRELAEGLAVLARAWMEAGDLSRAGEHARRRVALDPLNEAGHMQLMIVYAMMGDRAAALRQYETCVDTVRADLGVEPDPDVELLRADILAGEFDPAHRRPGACVPDGGIGREAGSEVPLPRHPTSFVGRDEELADVGALLANPACRLLSLVGAGGAGKSRLAVEAASRATGFRHGVCWVPLVGVDCPNLMVPTVAHATGFSFFRREDQEPRAQLLDYLREKQMLLVLDNFEHMLDGAGLLTDLLAAAPGIKLLVTSRERLNLQGEWVFQVGGMRYPCDATTGSIEHYAAVRLFLQRAYQADTRFGLDPADVPHLARICQLVDGMPLGLELAATWTRMLPLGEIAAEIERSLDFLETRDRDRPDRQRSQRAVFDHSWRLLAPVERTVFSRLSVFHGEFDRVAALKAAGAELAVLSALVDKSLLQARPSGTYAMHELVRQYAAEKLAAQPEDAAHTRSAHASYYLEWLKGQEPRLKGSDHTAGADAIAAEIENVRAAWHQALAQGEWGSVKGAAWGLATFYDVRSRFEEGYAAFQAAVGVLEGVGGAGSGRPGAALAVAVVFLGHFAARRYRVDEAMAHARRALALTSGLHDARDRALITLVAARMGAPHDGGEAEALLQASLDVFRAERDAWGVAVCLMALADLARFVDGDVALAQGYLDASYRVSRQSDDAANMAACLFEMAGLAQATGNRQEAFRLYGESLKIRRELRDGWGTAYCLDCMGYLARELGQIEESCRLHNESLALSREIGDQLGVAGSIDNLGLLARDRGQLGEARLLLEQALELRRAVGRAGDVAVSERHVAESCLHRGDYGAAVKGFRAAMSRARAVDWKAEAIGSELGLAEALLATGDTARAREHLAAALRSGLENEERTLITDALVVAARLLVSEDETTLAAAALACVAAAQASSYRTRAQAQELLEEELRGVRPEPIVDEVESIANTVLVRCACALDPSPR